MMGNLFNSKGVTKMEYSFDGENWHDLGNITGSLILKETFMSKIKRCIRNILWKICSPFSFSISYKKVKYSEKNKMPIDNLIKRWK